MSCIYTTRGDLQGLQQTFCIYRSPSFYISLGVFPSARPAADKTKEYICTYPGRFYFSVLALLFKRKKEEKKIYELKDTADVCSEPLWRLWRLVDNISEFLCVYLVLAFCNENEKEIHNTSRLSTLLLLLLDSHIHSVYW